MKKLVKQILKFGLVGGIAFVIDYGLLFIFTEVFHIDYLISSVMSFSISVIFNYSVSVLLVFEVNKERKKSRNFIIFVLLSIVGLGINLVIMFFGVEIMQWYYMLVKLFATIVVMIFNFITRKFFLE